MHNFWQRANALGTFAGTVLMFMCIAVTTADFFHKPSSTVSLKYLGAEGLKKIAGYDRAFLIFDFEADLRGEYTWNTKQLFVYVMLEFSSPRSPLNQMIVWNKIIQRKQNAVLKVPQLGTTFPFAATDQEGMLRNRNFNVTVAWHVMPKVGAMFTRSKTFSGFKMPSEYFDPVRGSIRPADHTAAAA